MDYLYFTAYKLTSIDADELFFLQTVQEGITGLRLLQAHHPWAEARPHLYQINTNMHETWSSALGRRYFVSLQVNPDWTYHQESAIQGECDRQMTLAAIALKRSQMRHGKLPSSLEALVSEFLAAVPWDYMSARPLCYRLKDDGSKLAVDLEFSKLEDFHPEAIVENVEPLKKLLEARRRLSDLRNKVVGNNKLEELLEEVVRDTEKLQTIKNANKGGE